MPSILTVTGKTDVRLRRLACTLLPDLRELLFTGVSEYLEDLEDLVARIVAPPIRPTWI